jgi:predicted DNA-binding transcriptional regulator YafY
VEGDDVHVNERSSTIVASPSRDFESEPILRERRAVELDYASLTGQRRMKIIFEPYGLLNHRGAWYVLGKSLTHAEDRIFSLKIERTLGAKILDRTFTVPKTFDLRSYTGDRLFIAGLATVEVKLRLRGDAARRLGPRLANTRRERDGTLLARFHDYPTGWLAAWILRQCPDVEVVSPPALARRVAAIATRVADAHG